MKRKKHLTYEEERTLAYHRAMKIIGGSAALAVLILIAMLLCGCGSTPTATVATLPVDESLQEEIVVPFA